MNFCNQCGHELGIGRFCTNCGHPVGQPAIPPVDQPADQPVSRPVDETAERPAVPPVAAPPAPATNPPQDGPTHEGSRFPLFADEVEQAPYDAPPAPVPPPPAWAPPPSPPRSRGGGVLPWVLGALVLVLLLLVGGMLLVRAGNDSQPTSGSPSRQPGPRSTGPGTTQPQTSGKPADIARFLQVEAPRPAAPNQDVDGNLVRYVATNMLDGVPTTCWRTPGDASGKTITFTLPRTTTVSEVGLINGYAKVATDSNGTYDWYRGNRRITAVEWTFDDGTTVRQHLDQTTAMQTVPVDHVVTDTISLRLVSVTPPGTGRASRNYTAISDVDVTGAAAG